MPDERLVIAIGRLERALARIESLPSPPPAGGRVTQAEVAELETRHKRLRAGATAALEGLDRLIDTGGSDRS